MRRKGKFIHDRLKNIAEKKIKTAFIGALDEFEKEFSYLFDNELNDLMKLKWEKVRKNILDRGNLQIRGMLAELDLHEIMFVGQRIEFGSKKDAGQNS